MHRSGRGVIVLGLLAAVAVVAACTRAGWQRLPGPDDAVALVPWFANMHTDIAIRPYKQPRLPVDGTVPVTGADPILPVAAPTPDMIARLGRMLPNPIPQTAESLERGRDRFSIYCALCHGEQGGGDGPIAPALNNIIPALTTDRARGYTDGYIYTMIQDGRGLMRGYGDKVRGDDRWHVVNYVRLLQGINR